MIPVYRPKNSPVHGLPVSSFFLYVLCGLLSVMMINNPFLLAGGLMAMALVFLAARSLADWSWYLRLITLMAVLYFFLNTIFSSQGANRIDYIPWVTWEEVVFGLTFGLKLTLALSIFVLFSLTVHPDRLLGVLRRRALNSAVALSIALRLFPTILRDANNIYEARISRGVGLDRGARPLRWMKRIGLTAPLLAGALERTSSMAESMECRGFGKERELGGPNIRENRRYNATAGWNSAYTVIPLISVLSTSGIVFLTRFLGWGLNNSYTIHIPLGAREALLALLLIAGMAAPAIPIRFRGRKV